MLLGIALVTIGWVAITAYHGSIWFLAPMIIFVGFGGAMMYAAMSNLIVEIVPADGIGERPDYSKWCGRPGQRSARRL
jgi:MFS family permease